MFAFSALLEHFSPTHLLSLALFQRSTANSIFSLFFSNSFQVYVQNWCSQLPGCSILSVDYSVSPEAKFPVALQQLLDVYLFVAGGGSEKELIETLGYRPDEFILAGDSAGGNLSMAALLVLNDINRQIRQLNDANNNQLNADEPLKPIKMPKSILNLYSPYNLTLNISPSMILASCDSMISAGVMLSCFEAYLPLVNLNEEPATSPTASAADPPETSWFSLAGLTRSIGSLLPTTGAATKQAFDEEKLANAEQVNDSSDWLEFSGIYVQLMELIQGLIGNLKCKLARKRIFKPLFSSNFLRQQEKSKENGKAIDFERRAPEEGRSPERFIIDIHSERIQH